MKPELNFIKKQRRDLTDELNLKGELYALKDMMVGLAQRSVCNWDHGPGPKAKSSPRLLFFISYKSSYLPNEI